MTTVDPADQFVASSETRAAATIAMRRQWKTVAHRVAEKLVRSLTDPVLATRIVRRLRDVDEPIEMLMSVYPTFPVQLVFARVKDLNLFELLLRLETTPVYKRYLRAQELTTTRPIGVVFSTVRAA
jgi:hypothetical protein